MTTVYVVTAGSGDSYRIERVYLDSDQAYGFAQDYNGIARSNRSGGGMAERAPPASTTARTGARSGGRAAGQQAARRAAAHRRGRTVRRLRHPPGMVDRGGAARRQGGAPGNRRGAQVEVVGLSKEKVEEIFWDAVTQARAELAGVSRK